LKKTVEKQVSELAKNHYENFPVASFLIPKELRKDISIVYWFARTADDLADEGNFSVKERLKNLDDFENEFSRSLSEKSNNNFFIILNETIKNKNLNPQNFYDLLSAFKQDVLKKRYKDFDEVLDYCRRSANPIGRIILDLNNIRIDDSYKFSDKICTALQLSNFYQDTLIDYQKGRIYYPQDEIKLFNVTENMFEIKENNEHISALVKHNVERTQNLFDEGKNLLKYLNGRLKIEIKWTIAGGEMILNKIKKNNYNVLNTRPKLSKLNYFSILVQRIFKNV
jgi:squalene synthase HpnC